MKKFLNYLRIVSLTAIIFLTIGCQDKSELEKFKEVKNKEANNIEIVKQFYSHLDKFLNKDDQKAFINLWTSEGKAFTGSSDASMSLKDMTPFLTMWYTAFPDLHHEIINLLASGKYVIAQVKYTGTQQNKFMDIAPTHKKIECRGVHIFKLVGGKISELNALDDDLAMFNQLGMELKPAKSKK